MKVLMVTSELCFSNSSAAIRNRILLEGLAANGDVDLLEVVQYKGSKKIFDVDDLVGCHSLYNMNLKIGSDKPEKINKKASFIKMIKNAIKNVIPDKLVNLDFYSVIDLDISCYDYIISTSEPKGLHFSVNRLLRYFNGTFKGKYIQYWGDPWFLDISRPTNWLTKIVEGYILGKADVVVYNSMITLKEQQGIFPHLSDKMKFIPRGVLLKKIELPMSIFKVDDVAILYAGDYNSKYRDIKSLVNFCDSYGIVLHFYGSGDATEVQSDSVKFFDRITSNELEKIYDNYTHQVVLMNSKGGQLPGKIYDCIGSKHKVIVILDGVFNEEHIPLKDRFIFADNNESSIRNALMKSLTYCPKNIDVTSFNIVSLLGRFFEDIKGIK